MRNGKKSVQNQSRKLQCDHVHVKMSNFGSSWHIKKFRTSDYLAWPKATSLISNIFALVTQSFLSRGSNAWRVNIKYTSRAIESLYGCRIGQFQVAVDLIIKARDRAEKPLIGWEIWRRRHFLSIHTHARSLQACSIKMADDRPDDQDLRYSLYSYSIRWKRFGVRSLWWSKSP